MDQQLIPAVHWTHEIMIRTYKEHYKATGYLVFETADEAKSWGSKFYEPPQSVVSWAVVTTDRPVNANVRTPLPLAVATWLRMDKDHFWTREKATYRRERGETVSDQLRESDVTHPTVSGVLGQLVHLEDSLIRESDGEGKP